MTKHTMFTRTSFLCLYFILGLALVMCSSKNKEAAKLDGTLAGQGTPPAAKGPNLKGPLISVSLPPKGDKPALHSVIDIEGNVILPLMEHRVRDVIEVSADASYTGSPVFFEVCSADYDPDYYDQGDCGVVSVTGETVVLKLEVGYFKVLSAGFGADREIFFKVKRSVYEKWDFIEYISERTGWREDVSLHQGECAGTYTDSDEKRIEDADVWHLAEDRQLVRFPKRAGCSPYVPEASQPFHDGSEVCELVSISAKEKLNKVDLKACHGVGSKAGLIPVMPVDAEGLWGYMNLEGEMVIPAVFEWVDDFDGEHANVKLSLDYARKLCDEKNLNVLINEEIFDACTEGLEEWERALEICSTDKLEEKLEDPNFREAVSLCVSCENYTSGTSDYDDECDWTNNWTKGTFVDTGWARIDKQGRVVTRFDRRIEGMDYEVNPVVTWGAIRLGLERLAKAHNYDYISESYEGRALVRRDGLYGYIDTHGREIIPLQYDAADQCGDFCRYDFDGDYDHGLHYVGFHSKGFPNYRLPKHLRFRHGIVRVKRNGLYGLIDRHGKVIAPIQYEALEDFKDGRALVKRNGVFGYIDVHGKEIISPQFKYVRVRSDSKGFIAEFDISYARALCGDSEAPPKTQNESVLAACETIKNDPIWVQRLKNCQAAQSCQDITFHALADLSGQIISRFDYEDRPSYSYRFKRHGLFGYADEDWHEVIPPQFEDAGYFSDGLAYIKHNGQYGYIDKTGHIVIKPQWDEAENFKSGMAKVHRIKDGEKQYAYIDKLGNVLTETYCFSSRYAIITGVIPCYETQDGPAVRGYPRTFSWAGLHVLEEGLRELNPEPANHSVRWVADAALGGFGLADSDGKWLVPWRLTVTPKMTRSGLTAFDILGDTDTDDSGDSDDGDSDDKDEVYLGWITAAGKIAWPPGWDDPCADTGGMVVWPKGSCK